MNKKNLSFILILLIVIIFFSVLFFKKDRPVNQNLKQQDISSLTPYKINTFEDFENSLFCNEFECNFQGNGKISTGDEFRKYKLLKEDVYLEMTVSNEQLYEINLAFLSYYENNEELNINVIFKLLNSIDSDITIDAEGNSAKEYIMHNIETNTYLSGEMFNWGPYFINVGKDGHWGWNPSMIIRRVLSNVERDNIIKINCPSPYRLMTDDGRCLWSCYPGSTPGANNECVCKPGYVETGKDKLGRRICELKK